MRHPAALMTQNVSSGARGLSLKFLVLLLTFNMNNYLWELHNYTGLPQFLMYRFIIFHVYDLSTFLHVLYLLLLRPTYTVWLISWEHLRASQIYKSTWICSTTQVIAALLATGQSSHLFLCCHSTCHVC